MRTGRLQVPLQTGDRKQQLVVPLRMSAYESNLKLKSGGRDGDIERNESAPVNLIDRPMRQVGTGRNGRNIDGRKIREMVRVLVMPFTRTRDAQFGGKSNRGV